MAASVDEEERAKMAAKGGDDKKAEAAILAEPSKGAAKPLIVPNVGGGGAGESKPLTLDQHVVFGRYSALMIVVYASVLFPQMLQMQVFFENVALTSKFVFYRTFSVYGGLSPRVTRCGARDFSNLSSKAACDAFALAQNETNCEPMLEAQFHSMAYEVCF